ncbi:uncharacterized protein PAC_16951 [Phialocephala subalpina]|uniref:F-box domain-containing protein n=1 Tax=Phialocephala subalpina TaxID=576137 RepID=A0A1L7XPS7_9HELO|nr:uncharacterized protein PAC_16951 [Phialocephala subalpina]
MASPFEKLPAEVLCSINLLLGKPELYSLSVASKTLSEISLKALVSDVALYPNDESVSRFCNLASTSRLAIEVRSVYIYTSNAPYVSRCPSLPKDEGDFDFIQDMYERVSPIYDSEKDTQMSDNFKRAIRRISELPNLDSVALQFDAYCGEEDGHWLSEPTETHTFRAKVLKHLVKTLIKHQAQPNHRRIRKLSLINLQNLNPEMTHSRTTWEGTTRTKLQQGFLDIMSGLDTFKMRIVNEVAIENESRYHFALWQPQNFLNGLFANWFRPCFDNLKHLTLLNDMYFGVIPSLKQTSVFVFPHLKSLTLENFVFGADWQLDWILEHKTLKSLHLINCAIIYHTTLIGEDKHEGYQAHSENVYQEQHAKGSLTWSYDKRWHDYFPVIRERLPRLKHFQFVGGEEVGCDERTCVRRRDWVENIVMEESRLFKEIYLIYDERETMKFGRVYLLGGDDAEDIMEPVRPSCEEEDEIALRQLLEGIGMRLPIGIEYNMSKGGVTR